MVSKKYREEFDIQKPYIVLVRNPETIKADWVNPEGHAYKPDVYMVKAMTKKEMKHRLNNKDGFSIQPQDIVLVVKEAMCVEQTIVSKIVGSFPKTEVKKSRLVKTIVNHF
jgi:hypothetical protein